MATPQGVLYTAAGNVCGDESKKKLAAQNHQYIDIPWKPFSTEGSTTTTTASKCGGKNVCYKEFKSTPELVNDCAGCNVVKSLIGQVVTKYHIFVGVEEGGKCTPSHELWNDPASTHPPTCLQSSGCSLWVGEPVNPTATPTNIPVPSGGTGVPTTKMPTTNAPTAACTAGAPADKGCPSSMPSGCGSKAPWYSPQSGHCHATKAESYYICCVPPPSLAPTTAAPTTPAPGIKTPAPTSPSTAPPAPANGTTPAPKKGPTAAPQKQNVVSFDVLGLQNLTWDADVFIKDLAATTDENVSTPCFRVPQRLMLLGV